MDETQTLSSEEFYEGIRKMVRDYCCVSAVYTFNDFNPHKIMKNVFGQDFSYFQNPNSHFREIQTQTLPSSHWMASCAIQLATGGKAGQARGREI